MFKYVFVPENQLERIDYSNGIYFIIGGSFNGSIKLKTKFSTKHLKYIQLDDILTSFFLGGNLLLGIDPLTPE